ncbi:MAG: GNAT family N-acetyltransferase [Opitutus sp.]
MLNSVASRSDSPPQIRSIHSSDLPALYRICHATGWRGRDASGKIADPDLIGHCYVGPYAVLEPHHGFVAVDRTELVGYVVTTMDSVRFHQRTEALWFPPLRSRYPEPRPEDDSPTATFVRALHRGHPPAPGINLTEYPAHLHINLLPSAQRRGIGRRLVETSFAALRKEAVAGVHLYVSSENLDGIRFYERLGFQPIDVQPRTLGFGYRLT